MARLLIGAGALLLALTLLPRRCGDPTAGPPRRAADLPGPGKRKQRALRTILWVEPSEPSYRG
jgi:hypothetical protein